MLVILTVASQYVSSTFELWKIIPEINAMQDFLT